MANTQQQESGLLSLLIGLGFKWVGWMLLAWLVLLFLATMSAFFLEHETVLRYTQQLLQHEINALSNISTTWLIKQPAHYANDLTQTIQTILWRKTQVAPVLDWLNVQEAKTSNKLFKQAIHHSLPFLTNYMRLLIAATQLTVIRLLKILLILPIFGLLGWIGFVDGLGQRVLRRLQGARESALLYHKARNAIVPSFIVGCFLYVVLPIYLPVSLLLLPFALVFAFLLSMATRMFKKYL